MAVGADPRLRHALELFDRGHSSAAARILRRLAELGDADAAAHLGSAIVYGVESTDPSEAAHWYEVAAKGGSALGALWHGLEIAEEDKPLSGEAAAWVEKGLSGLTGLAEEGDPISQYVLSNVFESGLGVAEDKKKALRYLRAAAKAGHLGACFNLGIRYLDQEDRTEGQRREGVRLMRRAADGGLRWAQYHLGANYATEPDMPINAKKSVRYYTMAAFQGNLEALYNLGAMHFDGEGVQEDWAAGHSIIIAAAERGDIGAQFYLMQAYEHGYHGAPVDLEEAAYWKARYDEDD